MKKVQCKCCLISSLSPPHRLFHHPSLYKKFHKQHHEWTAPIGVVATYAHPLEHMVSE